MGVCGMRNSPLVRTALLPSFQNGVKSLFAGFQSRINALATSALFCQAKEGEHQRSTPPQEPPIGRAASIRTCLLSRKRLCPDGRINLNAARSPFPDADT